MTVRIETKLNPIFTITVIIDAEEAGKLERYMSDHTGPQAPNTFKEILVELRGQGASHG